MLLVIKKMPSYINLAAQGLGNYRGMRRQGPVYYPPGMLRMRAIQAARLRMERQYVYDRHGNYVYRNYN